MATYLQELIANTTISIRNPELFREIFSFWYSSVALDFDMEAQTQSNWCWAATATSVSHFYSAWSTWTQCKVANEELDQTGCCGSPVPGACNVPWYLDRALTRTNNYVSITGPVDFETVRSEIRAGRPVGARIGWSGGGGHFMVIFGCGRRAGVEYFNIDDPIYGKSEPSVETFSSSYQGSGSWTHTYFTRRALVIKIKPYLISEFIWKKIWEARPSMRLHQSVSVPDAPEKGIQLGLAHPVFNAGLDAVREARLPETPAHVRIMELKGETPQAFFDVATRGEEAKVLTTAATTPYLELFTRGVRELLKATDRQEGEAELRLLQVPALYVDALWLHYDNAESDVFLPVRSPFGPEPFRLYPAKEFMEELRAKARERQTGNETIAP